MKPSKLIFEVGETIFRQPIILTHERTTGGPMAWTVRKEAADQRDDTVFISGIPNDVILKMAEAVKTTKGQS